MAVAAKDIALNADERTGIGRVMERMGAGFGDISGAIRAMPRTLPGVGPKLRGPVGKLMTVMQNSDSIEQRLAHVAEADAKSDGFDTKTSGAAHKMSSAQMLGISEALNDASKVAAKSIKEIEALRDDNFSEGDEGHTALTKGIEIGHQAVQGIAEAAEAAQDSAQTFAGMIDSSVTVADMKAADLSWYEESYTMDSERAVHKAAFS